MESSNVFDILNENNASIMSRFFVKHKVLNQLDKRDDIRDIVLFIPFDIAVKYMAEVILV